MLIADRNGFAVRKEDLSKYPGTVFIVTMGDNETFSLPIICASATTVKWGDGESSNYPSSVSRQTISHTYMSAGTYTIKITDTVSQYAYINETARSFPMQIIKFGDSAAGIGGYGFRYFYGLTSVDDFAGVNSLILQNGGGAFYGCSSLESIGNGQNLTTFNNQCFYSCSKLSVIGKYPNVTSIGAETFRGTGSIKIEKDTFPNVTTLSGRNTFLESKITEAEFPSLTTTVNTSGVEGAQIFRGCTKLTSIRAPNLTVLPQRFAWQCSALATCKVGLLATIGNGSYYVIFSGTPSSMRVWVKNTMASLMSFTGLPWDANNSAIFYCADGYVSRINGTWTGTAYSSVSDLPSVGDEVYEFQVGGTTYVWNGTAYEVKSV